MIEDTLTVGVQGATVPLVDLELIDLSRGLDRRRLLEDFGNGLRDVGFVAVKANSLNNLLPNVYQEMREYFGQSIEKKMGDWRDDNGQTGFSQSGRETAAGAKKADLKETYFIPPSFEDWPKNRPSFEAVMKEYHKELTSYAVRVIAFLNEYLDQATEGVGDSVGGAENLIRLAYYLAPTLEDEPEAVWAAAHTDLNALTLLPPSTIPGLELLTKEGEWVPVVVPQGYLIVNTGEQVMMKTAGLIRATPHRVVNPGGEYARMARFSSIFFSSWGSDESLKSYDNCVSRVTQGMSTQEKERYLMSYPNVTVKENLLSRLIELGSLSDPSEDLCRNLRSKGLLRQPPAWLEERYSGLF